MDFQEITRRAQWYLEQKAKPGVRAEGAYWPEVLVFRGPRFVGAMVLAADGARPLREEAAEAVAVGEGDAFVFVRSGVHPGGGDALLVYLQHAKGRLLWCTPFASDGEVTFRPTETVEGDAIDAAWEAALWRGPSGPGGEAPGRA